jgi:hypothetical protein
MARHGAVRVNVTPPTLVPIRGALFRVSARARAEEKENDYPFESIDFCHIFHDGETVFQLSFSLILLLLPLSLFVCWPTTSVLFDTLSPPLPCPLFLKHTMRFAVCVAAVGLVMSTGAQVRRGVLSARKFVSRGRLWLSTFLSTAPLLPTPRAWQINARAHSKHSHLHTQAWPEFIDKLKQVRG